MSAAVDPSPVRAIIRRARARAELHELAADLHQRGREPLDVLLAVGQRAALLRADGVALPPGSELAAVRALPGRGAWDAMAAWAARVAAADPAALVAGLEHLPTPEEEWEPWRAQRRPVLALADWLRANSADGLAGAIVAAATELATQILERARV